MTRLDERPKQIPLAEILKADDHHEGTRKEAGANARLISCAPEMAEMLLALIDRNRGVDHIEVKALLKKAGVL